MTAPFDPGLQVERTLLAWRRTSLTLAVGNAVALRVTVPAFGPAAVVAGLLGVVAAAGVWLVATRRYHRAHSSLVAPDSSLALGGVTVTIVALCTLVLAALGLGVVLTVQAHL